MKVCFVSKHFKDTSALLQTIIKMTPERSGKWREMEAVTDPFAADYVVCVDGAYTDMNIPRERALYFAQHPKGTTSYRSFQGMPEALGVFPNDICINPGEWWINYDYDTLMSLPPPKKTKDLISITTYRHEEHKPTYDHRIRFLEEYVKKSKNIDIYGRQEWMFGRNAILKDVYKGVAGLPVGGMDVSIGEHFIGKDIEIDYRYALDFDVGQTFTGAPVHNYLSERFYDSMLLWTMPIYFGGDNVHEFIPKDSFVYIRIDGTAEEVSKEAERAIGVVNSTLRERNITAIGEARQILMNELQIWPFVYNKIKSL